MALQQSVSVEMFVGKDASPSYVPDGRYLVKFPACWSRDAEEKLWFDCIVWGEKPTSENPTPQELGALASFVSDNVKEGDRILVRGRIKGTADGKPRSWEKDGKTHVAYLEMVVFELSISQAKSDRPARQPSSPASSDVPGEVTSLVHAPKLHVKTVPAQVRAPAADVFATYVSKTKSEV